MEGIRTQRRAIYIHLATHALLCMRMPSTYFSRKRFLSGRHTDFKSRDVQMLYKIRFVNYDMKTREEDRQR